MFSACSDSRNSAPDDDIDETALVSDEKKPAPAPAVGVGVDAADCRWAAGDACEREALPEEDEEEEEEVAALVAADSSGSSSSAKKEDTELKKDIACALAVGWEKKSGFKRTDLDSTAGSS